MNTQERLKRAMSALALFSLGVFVAITGQVIAGREGPGMGHFSEIIYDLNLSEQQLTTLKGMRRAIHSECFIKDKGPSGFMLDALAIDGDEELRMLVDKDVELMRASLYCMVEKVQTFKSTLTPEQLEELKLKVEQARSARSRWMDKWSEDEEHPDN